jgi:NAD(P)-dependent dehydrogenase (short-subunit alcohol dehydrogenase family)
MPSALEGRIAVVTGGSRDLGKGIALALGEAGATAYLCVRIGMILADGCDRQHP